MRPEWRRAAVVQSGCIRRAMRPAGGVAPLTYSRYARSSRLAGGAPRPSRCDADFHHGLLGLGGEPCVGRSAGDERRVLHALPGERVTDRVVDNLVEDHDGRRNVARARRAAHLEQRNHHQLVFRHPDVVAALVSQILISNVIPQPPLPGAYGRPEERLAAESTVPSG